MKHLAVTQNRKPATAPDRDSSTGPKRPSGSSSIRGMEAMDHSFHSAQRSQHYHKNVVGTEVRPSAMKMTKAEHQPQHNEDMSEKGHKL